MLTNRNYKFNVSLSDEAFTDKVISGAMIGTTKDETNRKIRKQYGFKANKGIGFRRTEVTSESLLDSLLQGKVFCHLFNPTQVRKDGSFASSQKKNDNFDGSYVIGVDIDHTNYNSAEEYVSKLSLQPTFYYTSYSNMQLNEDGTSKGARFRLIYVFDSLIENPYKFRYIAWKLNRKIEEDTNELITDDCNLRCSQYFNGTCKDNDSVILSYGLTNNIYSFTDLECNNSDFISFLKDYCFYKTRTIKRTNEIREYLLRLTNIYFNYNRVNKKFEEFVYSGSYLTTINGEMENSPQVEEITYSTDVVEKSDFSLSTNIILNDWDRLDEEEFKKCSEWESARRNTHYIYRTEKEEWVNNLYQYVDEDYFSLYYYTSTVKDGEKRRKNLYQRMCLRRILKPSITVDEMVVNTIIDIIRFCDNSDGVLNSDFIRRNIESCFNLTTDEIEEEYKGTLDYLRKTTKPKRGIIYINKQAHSKQTTYYILDEIYDSSVSVAGNLEFINNVLNYKVGKSTIYEYLNDRNIKPVTNKISDEELYNLLDVNLSFRKNVEFLRDNDIKIDDKRVRRIFKNKKNNISNNSISVSEELLSTTINDKMETSPHHNYYITDSSTSEIYHIDNTESLEMNYDEFYTTQETEDEETDYCEVINEEFNKFQFDLEVREKKLRHFTCIEAGNEFYELIDEVCGTNLSSY